MKKLVVLSIAVIFIFMFSSVSMARRRWPAPQQSQPTAAPVLEAPTGDVITACYKKVNGQLRIVSDASQCNPSEAAISWSMTGPEGPQGPAGPTGIVSTYMVGGEIGEVGGESTEWVFVGNTVSVPTTETQKITGVVQAPLGTLTEGVAQFGYDLCYRPAETTDPLTNFTGVGASVGAVSDTAGRLSFTAAASATPGEGTWEVGYCIMNSGAQALDNNDLVNGWVVLTE